MTNFCNMCECEVDKTILHLAKTIQICKKCEIEIKNMESDEK